MELFELALGWMAIGHGDGGAAPRMGSLGDPAVGWRRATDNVTVPFTLESAATGHCPAEWVAANTGDYDHEVRLYHDTAGKHEAESPGTPPGDEPPV